MFTQEQKNWAKSEIATIMNSGNNKTRYKKIAASATDLYDLENALLVVAHAKSQSYQLACQGKSPSSFGWAENDLLKEQNSSILILQHAFVDINDIAMLP